MLLIERANEHLCFVCTHSVLSFVRWNILCKYIRIYSVDIRNTWGGHCIICPVLKWVSQTGDHTCGGPSSHYFHQWKKDRPTVIIISCKVMLLLQYCGMSPTNKTHKIQSNMTGLGLNVMERWHYSLRQLYKPIQIKRQVRQSCYTATLAYQRLVLMMVIILFYIPMVFVHMQSSPTQCLQVKPNMHDAFKKPLKMKKYYYKNCQWWMPWPYFNELGCNYLLNDSSLCILLYIPVISSRHIQYRIVVMAPCLIKAYSSVIWQGCWKGGVYWDYWLTSISNESLKFCFAHKHTAHKSIACHHTMCGCGSVHESSMRWI